MASTSEKQSWTGAYKKSFSSNRNKKVLFYCIHMANVVGRWVKTCFDLRQKLQRHKHQPQSYSFSVIGSIDFVAMHVFSDMPRTSNADWLVILVEARYPIVKKSILKKVATAPQVGISLYV